MNNQKISIDNITIKDFLYLRKYIDCNFFINSKDHGQRGKTFGNPP